MGIVTRRTFAIIRDGRVPCYALTFGRNIFVALSAYGSLLPSEERGPIGGVRIVTRGAALLEGLVYDRFLFRRVIVTPETHHIPCFRKKFSVIG